MLRVWTFPAPELELGDQRAWPISTRTLVTTEQATALGWIRSGGTCAFCGERWGYYQLPSGTVLCYFCSVQAGPYWEQQRAARREMKHQRYLNERLKTFEKLPLETSR